MTNKRYEVSEEFFNNRLVVNVYYGGQLSITRVFDFDSTIVRSVARRQAYYDANVWAQTEVD